jgi:hypothetical protein
MKIGDRVPFAIRRCGRSSGEFDGHQFGKVVSFDDDVVCICYMSKEIRFVSRSLVEELIKDCEKG